MTTFKAVEKFLSILKENNVCYFVSGGFANEAIRGKITRKHKDLDIYVFEENLDGLFIKIKEKGYRCFRKLNKYRIHGDDLIVDVLPVRKINDQRVIIGNLAHTSYPAEIFRLDNVFNLEGFSFRLAPNELLVFEMAFSKYPEDKKDAKKLPYNEKLLSQIKNTPKTKPKDIPLKEF